MKILYDHQIFSYQEIGGVSKYFYKMLEYIPREYWTTSVLLSNNLYLENMKNDIRYSNFMKGYSFPKKERLMLELGKLYSIPKIKSNDYDILHITHYESYGLKYTKKPAVLTYHDKCFSSYAYNKRTLKQQKECLKYVDAIIAISENTKKDFLSLFDFPENKVSVIYHGVEPQVDVYSVPRLIQKKYILYVGGRSGYKNFSMFLEAFNSIIQKISHELILVCTGKDFDNNELKQINNLKLNNNILVKRFSDDELINLYRYAELFVFPSKYEGFGIPILEAMSNFCPVACSSTSCFPEIAGNAAVYFDPDDKDSIINAMFEVLLSDSKRKTIIELGKKRSLQFTWKKTAQEHINFYQTCL